MALLFHDVNAGSLSERYTCLQFQLKKHPQLRDNPVLELGDNKGLAERLRILATQLDETNVGPFSLKIIQGRFRNFRGVMRLRIEGRKREDHLQLA